MIDTMSGLRKVSAAAVLLLTTLLAALPACGPGSKDTKEIFDLVLDAGRIWSGTGSAPRDGWIAIRGDRIPKMGVGEAPAGKKVLDLKERLVLPGFNDSHVHFASAGRLLLGANLLDVSDDDGLIRRIREAAERLPEGSWITGGDWGAYEAWESGSEGGGAGRYRAPAYRPHRALIDATTPDHPVLVRRFDRKMGLANARALEHLGLASDDGVLEGKELEAALEKIPAPSRERRLAEAHRALRECREWGVTTVQDMSPLDQVELYRELRERGELTVRLHFSPSRLSDVESMIDRGWTVGSGDPWIRFGTVKSHVDGIMGGRTARFFEPYDDNPAGEEDWRGG
jgi:predicted amidohydrolase YtcJ